MNKNHPYSSTSLLKELEQAFRSVSAPERVWLWQQHSWRPGYPYTAFRAFEKWIEEKE